MEYEMREVAELARERMQEAIMDIATECDLSCAELILILSGLVQIAATAMAMADDSK